MSFTDLPFPYGPFAPHWIPKQYIENYFSWHRTDDLLVLNTTVEDVTLIDRKSGRWRLTLRRPNATREEEEWWQEEFDGLIIANGHYSVPFVSQLVRDSRQSIGYADYTSRSHSCRISQHTCQDIQTVWNTRRLTEHRETTPTSVS